MNKQYKVTIFTPTYNRAHTLPKIYDSLLQQDNVHDFEWLIIDDCSSDDTPDVVRRWIAEGKVNINYIRLSQNGGKPRAINIAVENARSPYLFILDSDDYLVPNILPVIVKTCEDVLYNDEINGVGVLNALKDGTCLAKPTFEHTVDASDLQRADYGIAVDCNEAYKISVLKKYPFVVWDGETFTPESTVLFAMALDGYKLRWLNKVGVVIEYLDGGLTKGSWNLQKKNPMGYAMLFNSNLRFQKGFVRRFKTAMLFSTQCLLGKNIGYIRRSNAPILTMLSFPFSLLLYVRRLWQYQFA